MEKTLQELYNEVVKDSKLIKEFTEAEKEGKLVEFAKAHGCSATEEEIKKLIESIMPNGKELSSGELDQVAGGKRVFTFKCDKCGQEVSGDGNLCGKKHKEAYIVLNGNPPTECDGILR